MAQMDWVAIAALGTILIAAYALIRRLLPPAPRQPPTPTRKPKGRIVIDGTNVLFWDAERAQIRTLRAVVDHVRGRGYEPVVFLDASSRHHVGDRSLDGQGFARVLGAPRNQVMICPARTEADAFILHYAQQNRLPVLSNDRFRDRQGLVRRLRVVRGRVVNGKPSIKGL